MNLGSLPMNEAAMRYPAAPRACVMNINPCQLRPLPFMVGSPSQIDCQGLSIWGSSSQLADQIRLYSGYQPLKEQSIETQTWSPYSVFLGRGKAAKDWVGNRRLKVLAETRLAEYAKAKNKMEKSEIVSSLRAAVHDAGGSFVKSIDGVWQEADDLATREKIGSLFRDLLHDKYRSSSKSKVSERQRRRLSQQEQNRKGKKPKRGDSAKNDSLAASVPQVSETIVDKVECSLTERGQMKRITSEEGWESPFVDETILDVPETLNE